MTSKSKEPERPANRRWLKMGVELEGGWDTDYRTVAADFQGATGKTDSSVKNLPGYMGEINTKPHTHLDALVTDVIGMHPLYTNETAGLHIHASFTPMDTSLLTTAEFWAYFTRRWEAWGAAHKEKMTKKEWGWFHSRLSGGGKFCKAEFKPLDQFENHEDKYTQLNFISYSRYKTVECRVLPMFESKEITALAIRELSDIYDTFLNDFVMPPIKMEKRHKENATKEVLDREVLPLPDRAYFEVHEKFKGRELPVGEGISYHIEGAAGFMLPFNTAPVIEP